MHKCKLLFLLHFLKLGIAYCLHTLTSSTEQKDRRLHCCM